MSTSVVEICNLALGKLGQENISSISDDSAAARKCATIFDHSLDFVLRQHLWHCARHRVAIAPLSSTPVGSKWSLEYQLPSSPYCLRVMAIVEEDAEAQQYPFMVEGRKLLTNQPSPLNLFYIKRITDMNELDALCLEAFATYLAFQIAYPLLGSTSLRDRMEKDFADRMRDARLIDSQESTPDIQSDGDWTMVR